MNRLKNHFTKLFLDKQLKELKDLNWNNPYIQRNFEVYSKRDIKYIIENYLNKFAFGIKFGNRRFSLIKDDEIIYIRNDENYEFKNKFDKPPVHIVYDVKSSNIDEIVSFV